MGVRVCVGVFVDSPTAPEPESTGGSGVKVAVEVAGSVGGAASSVCSGSGGGGAASSVCSGGGGASSVCSGSG
ncbi:MAG: hypothetical protein HC797_04905, partial [Anaerolineales bacterium]|nr:hypothetical protein [Anaerolineales bacterium]